MNRDSAEKIVKGLKASGLSEHGVVEVQEDAPEFGEDEFSIRFHTGSRTLPTGAMNALTKVGAGITFLGEKSDIRRFLWLVEP